MVWSGIIWAVCSDIVKKWCSGMCCMIVGVGIVYNIDMNTGRSFGRIWKVERSRGQSGQGLWNHIASIGHNINAFIVQPTHQFNDIIAPIQHIKESRCNTKKTNCIGLAYLCPVSNTVLISNVYRFWIVEYKMNHVKAHAIITWSSKWSSACRITLK